LLIIYTFVSCISTLRAQDIPKVEVSNSNSAYDITMVDGSPHVMDTALLYGWFLPKEGN
jgi:hypothetical protein